MAMALTSNMPVLSALIIPIPFSSKSTGTPSYCALTDSTFTLSVAVTRIVTSLPLSTTVELISKITTGFS